MKRVKEQGQGSRTHSFIEYKVVPKSNYKTNYKNISMTKPEEKNFLYRHLKNQKIITTIFARIFRKDKKVNTDIDMEKSNLFKTRPKTQMDEYETRAHSYHHSAAKSYIEKMETRKEVQSFNKSLHTFHKSMSVNNKRINILARLNRTVKNFESKLPQDMGEQTRQSIEENQKLIQLCIEDSLAKQQKQTFNERYQQIREYKEPDINDDMKLAFIKKRQKNRIKIRDQLRKANRDGHLRINTDFQ